MITRTGWTSEVGYEVYLHGHDQGHRGLRGDHGGRAGRSASVPPARATSAGSRARIFNWGADMTYENNPLEMGLERLVDWDLDDDACISIAALRSITGARRRGDGSSAWRWTATRSPSSTTSSGRSSDAGRADRQGDLRDLLAAARDATSGSRWLPVERSTLGERVTVETRVGRRGTAIVVAMPFVDPSKQIPVS